MCRGSKVYPSAQDETCSTWLHHAAASGNATTVVCHSSPNGTDAASHIARIGAAEVLRDEDSGRLLGVGVVDPT